MLIHKILVNVETVYVYHVRSHNTMKPFEDIHYDSVSRNLFECKFWRISVCFGFYFGGLSTTLFANHRIVVLALAAYVSGWRVGANGSRAVYGESHDNWPAGAMLFLHSITSSIGSYWEILQLQTDSWVSGTSQAHDFPHKDASLCFKKLTKICQRRTSEKQHFFRLFWKPLWWARSLFIHGSERVGTTIDQL